jgi:hypothetical protein
MQIYNLSYNLLLNGTKTPLEDWNDPARWADAHCKHSSRFVTNLLTAMKNQLYTMNNYNKQLLKSTVIINFTNLKLTLKTQDTQL